MAGPARITSIRLNCHRTNRKNLILSAFANQQPASLKAVEDQIYASQRTVTQITKFAALCSSTDYKAMHNIGLSPRNNGHFQYALKLMWFADDLMVVIAVSSEPVSALNSLLYGKIQGKYSISIQFWRFHPN